MMACQIIDLTSAIDGTGLVYAWPRRISKDRIFRMGRRPDVRRAADPNQALIPLHRLLITASLLLASPLFGL